MMREGSVEYAYARVAARYGCRLDETQWHRIESSRTLAALLDAVRSTSLERFVAGIGSDSDVHAIECAIRDHWRRETATVAGWMPLRWQAATAWWGALPDVPVLAHLASGGEPPAWMRRDARYRALLEDDAATSELAPLRAPGRDAAGAWGVEWKRRLPREDGGPLARLARLAARHFDCFARHPPGDGAASRRALQHELAKLFRVAIATPAAMFAFLALGLLDVERLRGELVRRASFAGWPLAR